MKYKLEYWATSRYLTWTFKNAEDILPCYPEKHTLNLLQKTFPIKKPLAVTQESLFCLSLKKSLDNQIGIFSKLVQVNEHMLIKLIKILLPVMVFLAIPQLP